MLFCNGIVLNHAIIINGVENSTVLLSYPKDAFLNPKALIAFLSTDVSLCTCEILDSYMER